jgi:hypothetical protein
VAAEGLDAARHAETPAEDAAGLRTTAAGTNGPKTNR